jgi:hypothetical protein
VPVAVTDDIASNPIDCLEDLISLQSWPFERLAEDALVSEIRARWHTYSVQFLWRSDVDTLVYACNYSLEVQETQRPDLFRLLICINDGLMSGCFNYSALENILSYRNSLRISADMSPGSRHLRDFIGDGIEECERYFLAFDMLLNRQQNPEQAYQAAVFETMGEA